MEEQWKSIPNHEGYEVSNLGRIRSYRSPSGNGKRRIEPKILKPIVNKKGYQMVNLDGGLKKLARVICESFLGKSDLQVNHKNGIKTDDRLDNLEYCTGSQNCQHAFDTGLRKKGFGARGSGLTESDIKNICKDTRSTRQIAPDYGISQVHVSRIKRSRHG